jgi:hypothetical protein
MPAMNRPQKGNAMFDATSSVPLLMSRQCVTIYGREFPFRDLRERQQAVRDAKAYGQERQAVMRKQAGRALTTREQLRGDLELPTDRAPSALYTQREPDPNRNHWLDRVNELRRQVGHTRDEKARLQHRIEVAQRMADEWETERTAELAMTDEPDSDVARMRRHAEGSYERCRNDPNATIAGLVSKKRLLAMAQSNGADVGEYWDAVRSIELELSQSPATDNGPPRSLYQ